MATTPGHLMGFFYMLMLFVKCSLFMTRAHVNRWWTATLELFVVFHGAIVAYFAIGGQEGPAWAQFLWGGLAIFLITQLHGLKLKRWHKWALALLVFATGGVYYAFNIGELQEIPRVIAMRYVAVAVLAALIWLVMRPFDIVSRSRQRAEFGCRPGCNATNCAHVELVPVSRLFD